MELGRCLPIFFLFFSLFPCAAFGITCGYGGMCYGYEKGGAGYAMKSKECSDACVSFKCFVSALKVMEGAGCYEDFDNACKYVRTEVKDKIKANLGNSSIRERDLYFKSCNDANGCATNGLNGSFMIKESPGEIFTSPVYGHTAEDEMPCKYDNKPKLSQSTVKCQSMISCESGRMYARNASYSEGPIKTCDACVKYSCTSDGGKTVVSGYGCPEDFEAACGFLDADVKEKFKKNIKDAFMVGSNYKLFSCSESDDCQIFSDSLFLYNKLNEEALTHFRVDETSYQACSEKTTIPASTVPVPTSTAPASTTATTADPGKEKEDQTTTTTSDPKEESEGKSDATDVYLLTDSLPSAAKKCVLEILLLLGLTFIYFV